MTPFESYCTYLAFKLHFSQCSYDFFKYNKKVNATRASFDRRRDKYFFEKIAATMTEEKFILKMLAQTSVKTNFWIRDLLTEENEKERKKLLKILESFSYSFREDMNSVLSQGLDLNSLIKMGDEHYPPFFNLKVQHSLSIPSIIALDLVFNFLAKYNVQYKEDVLWDGDVILDYKPFLIKYIDRSKVIHILKEVFA